MDAILIRADGTVSPLPIKGSDWDKLMILQAQVEGYVESVRLTDNLNIMFNEEARVQDGPPLPANRIATELCIWHFMQDGRMLMSNPLVGNAVVVSHKNGDVVGLSEEQYTYVQGIIDSLKEKRR